MPNNILKIVADNPALFDLLKKTIIDKFMKDIPDSEVGIDDVVLGQILRARLVGVKKVEDAFREILSHKTIEEEPEKINIAR